MYWKYKTQCQIILNVDWSIFFKIAHRFFSIREICFLSFSSQVEKIEHWAIFLHRLRKKLLRVNRNEDFHMHHFELKSCRNARTKLDFQEASGWKLGKFYISNKKNMWILDSSVYIYRHVLGTQYTRTSKRIEADDKRTSCWGGEKGNSTYGRFSMRIEEVDWR